MRVPAALAISSLLFFQATSSGMTADKELDGADRTIPGCVDIEPNILLREAQAASLQSTVDALSAKRNDGTITEEENHTLFSNEITLYELRANISLGKFFLYYCRHPDKIPPAVNAPRGPVT